MSNKPEDQPWVPVVSSTGKPFPVVTITSFSNFLEDEHATILEKVVAEEVSRVTEILEEGVLDRYKRTESIL